MTSRITVLGSLNMDLVIQAPRHPLPGETLTGGAFRTFPGGKGANQAVAAARLAAQVSMVGRVGADAFGAALIASLQANGVDTSGVARAPEATGVALITVSASGENTIVIAPGANGTLTPEDITGYAPYITGADVLLLQLEVPLPIVEAAAALARRHGVPVILNPAPAQPLPASLLRHVTYLIPNQHEAALLSGLPAATAEQMAAAAAALQAQGVGNVIVTLGAQGAVVFSGATATAVPSFRVDVVDTTAAGDAFVGGFAVALTEGRPLLDAVRWGCATGALACTVYGAQPSLPRRAEVLKLLAEQS